MNGSVSRSATTPGRSRLRSRACRAAGGPNRAASATTATRKPDTERQSRSTTMASSRPRRSFGTPVRYAAVAEPQTTRLHVSARSVVLAVAMLGLTIAGLALLAASTRVIGWILVAATLAGLLHPAVAGLTRWMRRGL